MNDFQAIADRVEIEALRGEFTDAVMMRDRTRLASLFTSDAVLRMPAIGVELTGTDDIRAGAERLQAQWDLFVQNTHPGSIRLDGDDASGRAYMQEIVRLKDGYQGVNYAVYHDRYRRTPAGWRFAERVYEIRYDDPSPLAGSSPAPTLERAAAALAAHNFTVEILDDAAAARTRVAALIPSGASVLTASSETLRLSGIDADLNTSGRYVAVRPQVLAMDRATRSDDIRRLAATPDFVVGSVNAVTETGSLVTASGTGSQLPAYVGGAARAIWVVGSQKLVPDLDAALRRIQEHALPLESARTQQAYGQPSAINQLLILNAVPRLAHGTVLLLREPLGF
jgi:ketosteroid isomerase-like protein